MYIICKPSLGFLKFNVESWFVWNSNLGSLGPNCDSYSKVTCCLSLVNADFEKFWYHLCWISPLTRIRRICRLYYESSKKTLPHTFHEKMIFSLKHPKDRWLYS